MEDIDANNPECDYRDYTKDELDKLRAEQEEDEIIKFVQEEARYYKGFPRPYAVKYNGVVYWDKAPDGLVKKILSKRR